MDSGTSELKLEVYWKLGDYHMIKALRLILFLLQSCLSHAVTFVELMAGSPCSAFELNLSFGLILQILYLVKFES